jgi:DNA-binding LytR/AlgR family response regulator
MLSVLIVEDEPLVQQRIARLCRELLGPSAQIDCASSLDDADDALRKRAIDLLLLDLNLQGEDGFTLLHRAIAATFHTVVISAHADRALDAFALGVLDFLAKPFPKARLAQALERAQVASRTSGRAAQQLGVWRARGVALVPVEEIAWIQADGDYSALQLMNGRRELHDKTLDRLQQLLPAAFVRIHRSYVVNMRQADTLLVEGGGRYRLRMQGGTELPVGRSRVQSVRERLL